MKWVHIGGWFLLGGALTVAGCVTPEPAPPIGQAVLEAQLAALDTRLATLEQQSAAQRVGQEQWQVLDQSLIETNRTLKDTRNNMAKLQREVEKIAERPKVVPLAQPPRVISEDVWKKYQSVDVALGALPDGGGGQVVRPIPAAVPDSAREILVYAQVATGYVEGGSHRFRVATALEDGREVAFYLYAIAQSQSGWGYNSDTVWLPMPKNRQLILQAEGKPFFGEWNSEVRIIGYR
ncbi:MAG: hypothetical protein IAF00_05285 [Phycisphaerales bacterium]|nr:hypothetical protein [Phycisphaerales bacterium]